MTRISLLIIINISYIWLCNGRFVIINRTRSQNNYDYLGEIATESHDNIDIWNYSEMGEEVSSDTFSKRSVGYRYKEPSSFETTTEEPVTPFLTDEFLNCTTALTYVEPEFYRILQNGAVHVPLYNIQFEKGNYLINPSRLLLVCPDFFDAVENVEEKFSSTLEIISIVGISISSVCIVLHIIMFIVVKKMRNLPGYCMVSLCSALLVAYICCFIQFKLHDNANCTIIGMIIYFGFLSSFFWMNVISFDVWRAIRQATTKLRLSSDRPVVTRFLIYSSYGWGAPLLILIMALILDHVSTDVQYKLIFSKTTCWFQYKTPLMIYFGLPLFILLFVNILFFITSLHMIASSTMSKSDSGSHVGSDLRSQLFLSLRLGTAMGLMWIFGVLATLTQQEWINYLFSVCNALQGVFIFFSFTVNSKTIKACKKVSKKVRKWSVLPGPIPKPTFVKVSQTTTDAEMK